MTAAGLMAAHFPGDIKAHASLNSLAAICLKYCLTKFALSGFARSCKAFLVGAFSHDPTIVPLTKRIAPLSGRICSCIFIGCVRAEGSVVVGFCCLRIAIHKIATAIIKTETWMIVVSLFIELTWKVKAVCECRFFVVKKKGKNSASIPLGK